MVHGRVAAAVAVIVSLLAGPAITVAGSQEAPPGGGERAPSTAAALSPASRTDGYKAASSRVVESDPELLERRDGARVPVVIKFDYDAVASYRGGLQGMPATSPSATGQPLTAQRATQSAYARHIASREAQIVDAIQERVPSASIGHRFRVVYGGVAARIPANLADDLLAIDGVVAVQSDRLEQPQTDSSTEFVGAPPAWSSLGGQELAGAGVLFGSLDTGVWPEHPSFAANPELPAAPLDTEGNPITCDFGDNPLTPATDVFPCNNKLVGGQPFLDTYNDVQGGEVYPDSARDSDGHGTHTSSTAAGGIVDEAPVFGEDHGPISGMAPGAAISVYKVCGLEGCFSSDSAAAVEQAIFDGVDVINFSIGGGSNPFADSVELAFLDAYAAGVFVATSAGNEGPGPSTSGHLSPWVTTVAASSQDRQFATDLVLASSDTATLSLEGSTITAGTDGTFPVVLAEDVPGYTGDELCGDEPSSADLFDGMIVACERGGGYGRVEKGFNMAQGGAEGMILYNPTLQDTETDNHWLPVVHLADGAELLAFLDAHPDVTATWDAGEARPGNGDVIAGFSSRGPGGYGIKPDVTAPGVQILAGMTPTPDNIDVGPPGEYFQAIAGTSMSSPHVAGAGILLAALHPDWDPGQIKSALMTTATTAVVKEDEVTPADPFDMGSGRIVVSSATDPGLTISDDADHFFAVGNDPVRAIDANIASINAPIMPGRVVTTRVVENVGSTAAIYDATATAPPGTSITVSPARFSIGAGATRTLTITIAADDAEGQQFGSIALTAPGRTPLHLPVAFVPTQGSVSLTSDCGADDIVVGEAPTTCTVTAQNDSFDTAEIDITSTVNDRLKVVGSDADAFDADSATLSAVLAGRTPGTPSLDEYGPLGSGYLPLELFDIPGQIVGDEESLFFEDVPPFLYNGVTYTSFNVVSNGYVIPGPEIGSESIEFVAQDLPNPVPPNNVLAPFWSDLTGDGLDDPAPDGISVAVLEDGPLVWTVVQFELNAWGTDEVHNFQVWLGGNGEQDITFNYDPDTTSYDGLDLETAGLTVGAENEPGTGGDQLDAAPDENNLPPVDLSVVSTDPEPGDSVSYTVDAAGVAAGTGVLHTELTSPSIPGVTVVESEVAVLLPTEEVEAFVDQAFMDFLGRHPAPDRLAFWTDQIVHGAPRTDLLNGLANGVEYRTRLVNATFRDFIGRNPTASERAHWVSELGTGGLSQARLVAFLGGSNAFKVLAGGTTGGFVDRIHQEILGRNPTAPRRAYWVNQINNGFSRAELARIMYQSKESRDIRVRDLYAQLLHRAPAAGPLATRAQVLLTQPDKTVAIALAASDEYYLKAQ